jgi:hypothetical protein
MSQSGGLYCKNHGGHIGRCAECEIESLQARVKELERHLAANVKSKWELAEQLHKLKRVVDAAKTFFIEREKGEVCDCLGSHYSDLQDTLGELDGEKK